MNVVNHPDIMRFNPFPRSTSVKRVRGFTLLEMMIAVSIIAIVLTAIYRLHSQTLLMNSDARFQTMAPLLAQRKLADLELLGLENLEDGSGDFGEDFAGYGWLVSIVDVESELIEKVMNNFKQIDITIQIDGSNLTYNLRTFRFFPD